MSASDVRHKCTRADQRSLAATIIESQGEAAIMLPEDLVSRLGLKEGDLLSLDVIDGGLRAVVVPSAS